MSDEAGMTLHRRHKMHLTDPSLNVTEWHSTGVFNASQFIIISDNLASKATAYEISWTHAKWYQYTTAVLVDLLISETMDWWATEKRRNVGTDRAFCSAGEFATGISDSIDVDSIVARTTCQPLTICKSTNMQMVKIGKVVPEPHGGYGDTPISDSSAPSQTPAKAAGPHRHGPVRRMVCLFTSQLTHHFHSSCRLRQLFFIVIIIVHFTVSCHRNPWLHDTQYWYAEKNKLLEGKKIYKTEQAHR